MSTYERDQKKTSGSKKYPNALAKLLEVHHRKVQRLAKETNIPLRTLWEYVGERSPIDAERLEILAAYFHCRPEQILSKVPTVWNVPYQRNPFFTGRESILAQIYDILHKKSAIVAVTQTCAVTGLGGIGKTQTVLEYTYHFCEEYEAIFWIKSDSHENLLSGFLQIATLLQLPERNAPDTMAALAAIHQWMREHHAWLLVLDNADDLTLAREFLPTNYNGHILLTTRAQAMGRLAHRLDIEEMDRETGMLFLLRRAGFLTPEQRLEDAPEGERLAASDLVRELAGLPLALDQAGAYIEEHQCNLTDYIQLYQVRHLALLSIRGGMIDDHPQPVATTWSLSFTEVERHQPAAADLLRVCAFLDPDAIPEEIIIGGTVALGPALAPLADDALALHEAIASLWKYSLIRRNPETKMLSLHRLVQVVLKEGMDAQTQRLWAERALRAVFHVFPAEVKAAVWPQCQRLLPHVMLSASHIDAYGFAIPEAATMCNQAGYYLREQALYRDAEALYQRALRIREQVLGNDHQETAQVLYNLARVYFELGQYSEAERLNLKALAIREHVLPPGHLDIALSLNNLAFLYYLWEAKQEQAQELFQRALLIFEQTVGLEHPRTAHCLSNLALLYAGEGRYEEAERLLLQTLDIRERLLGHLHLDTARSLQNLAWLYIQQRDRYEEAERFLEESLFIREMLVGEEHPQVANSLHHMALLCEAQGQDDEAERLYQRAIAIRRKMLGADNPKVVATEEAYTVLLRRLGKDEEAARLEAHVQAMRTSTK